MAVYTVDPFYHPGGGWIVVGGTSAASPIIASTYALAGTAVSGTYPASYLFANPAALFDVTGGSNGNCGGSYAETVAYFANIFDFSPISQVRADSRASALCNMESHSTPSEIFRASSEARPLRSPI